MGYSAFGVAICAFILLSFTVYVSVNSYDRHLKGQMEYFEHIEETGARDRTSFDLTYVNYSRLRVELDGNNTGSETIKLTNKGADCMDVYLDERWIEKNRIDTGMLNTTFDPLLWNPTEHINITVKKILQAGDHIIRIVDCDGVSANISFTLEDNVTELIFIAPTMANDSQVDRDWTEAKILINEPELDAFRFNWNRTNYTVYNSSLMLCLNCNNNTLTGDNATYASDSSTYNHNATLVNGTGYDEGRFGTGVELDGVNQYVQTEYIPDNLTDYSITMWFKTSATLGDGLKDYLFGVTGDQDNKLGCYHYPEGDITCFNEFGGSNVSMTASTGAYNDGRWHFLAVSHQANGSAILYVDDLFESSKPASNGSLTNTEMLRIGAVNDADPGFFEGTIDEVRVYDNPFSPDEIDMYHHSEFARYNATEYRFFVNVTGLVQGNYTYYGWANDTRGNQGWTDEGWIDELIERRISIIS